MEATTWQTDQVADRHRDPTVTVRPTGDDKSVVSDSLAAKGWTLQAFLLACIRGYRANPKRWLAAAAPYRPPEKPIGRPPKTDRTPDREGDDGLTREPFEDPA